MCAWNCSPSDFFLSQEKEGEFWVSGRSEEEARQKASSKFGVPLEKIMLKQGTSSHSLLVSSHSLLVVPGIVHWWICYSQIRNPAHFETSRSASKWARWLQNGPAGFTTVRRQWPTFETGWLGGFKTSLVDTNVVVTGQLIHQSANGSSSWLRNQQKIG